MEISDVVSGETIEATWGNSIRDRTIQRYATTVERTNKNPTPTEGDLAYMEDTNVIEVYDGAAWVGPADARYVKKAGDTMTGPLLLNGSAAGQADLEIQSGALGSKVSQRVETTDDWHLDHATIGSMLKVGGPAVGSAAGKFQTAQLPDNRPKTITYLNSYVGFFTEVATWKDPGGTVHMQGMCRGLPPTGIIIGNVFDPNHYPTTTIFHTNHLSGTGTVRYVSISTAGLIQFGDGLGTPPSGQWFNFQGLSWFVGW